MKKIIALVLAIFLLVPNVYSEMPVTASAESEQSPVFDGIVFSRVSGNGGKKDATCRYSFIELYNTTENDIFIAGLAVYYKSAEDEQYTEYDFGENAKIAAGSYYLVRGNEAKKYQSENELISVDNQDATWDITISNKAFSLVLAPAGMDLDPAVPLYDLEGIVSYLCTYDSTAEYFFDSGYIDDFSKNKFAVRTALREDSGWYLVNLSKANSSKLLQIVPMFSGGKAGSYIKSALNEVYFSSPSGYYENGFELALSAKEGYEIYYTTDGSDPTTSTTRIQYTAPLALEDTGSMGYGATTSYVASVLGSSYLPSSNNLPGGYVIKAYATDGTESTDVYTSSYFISDKFAGYGIDIVSISLDKEEFVGDNGFYNNYYINDANLSNPRSHAIMEVFDENGTRQGYSEVELSISGHGSARDFDMKSMKVFYKKDNNKTGGKETKLYYDVFDGSAKNSKGQAITTNSRLILRSSSHDLEGALMRDGFHQLMAEDLDIDTQAIAPTLVFINGEFWGLYNFRERYCGEYFEAHYGVDEDSVAVIENDFRAAVEDHDGNAPYVVSNGPDDAADSFNTLVEWIKSHDMSKEENYNYVCQQLDVYSLMDMYILRLYYNCLDWPLNNIKLWKNLSDEENNPSGCDTKWHYLLLDCDFGSAGKPSVQMDANVEYTDNNFSLMASTGNITGTIMYRLLKNETFKNEYLTRFYKAINESFDYETKALPVIDTLVSERSPFVSMMAVRWGINSTSQYSSSVNKLKAYAQKRKPYAIGFLCSYFGISEKKLRVLCDMEEINLVGSAYDFFLVNDTIQNPNAHGADWFASEYPDGIVNMTGRNVQSIGFQGWVGYNDTLEALGYTIDGGTPVYSSSFFRTTEDTVKKPEHGGQYASRFRITVPVSNLEGSHTISIVAKVCGKVFVIDGFTLTYVNGEDPQEPDDPVEPVDPDNPVEPGVTATYHGGSFDSVFVNGTLAPFMNGSGGGASAKLDAVGRILDCSNGSANTLMFKGWIGFEEEIASFGYQIDDGEPEYGNFIVSAEAAVRYDDNGGAKAQRYEVSVPVSGLKGDHSIAIVVKLANGAVVRIDENVPKIPTQPAPNTSLTYRGPAAPVDPEEPDDPEPEDPETPEAAATYHGGSFDSVYIDGVLAPFMGGKAGNASGKLDDIGRILDCSDNGANELTFKGWIGFEEKIDCFGYLIDDRAPVFGDYIISSEEAVRYDTNGGANAQRYEVTVPVSGLNGNHTIAIVVKLKTGAVVRIDENVPKIPTQPAPNTSLTYLGVTLKATLHIFASKFIFDGNQKVSEFMSKVSTGTAHTVEYTGDNFLFWVDDNGFVVSTEPQYKCTFMNATTLNAVVANAEEGFTAIKFITGSGNGQVVAADTIAGGDLSELSVPEVRSFIGNVFSGWTVYDPDAQLEYLVTGGNDALKDCISELISAGSKNIILKAYYEKTNNSEIRTVTVTYVCGETSSENVYSVVGDAVKVYTAPETYEGQSFAGWYVGNELVCTNLEYVVFVDKDMDLIVRYSGSDALEQKPIVDNISYEADASSGTNTLVHVTIHNVPEEYEMVSYGTLYSTSVSDPAALILENVDGAAVRKIEKDEYSHGYMTSSIIVGNMVDTVVYVRGFLVVRDESGVVFTYYTDILSGSFNSIGTD